MSAVQARIGDFEPHVPCVLGAPNQTSREPVNNERRTVFWGSLAESARAEEKNHRGTEGTEKGCDLCLRALCASVV